jgi:hypothetical protein
MKRYSLIASLCFITTLQAQTKEVFDIVTYSAPTGWIKEVKENLISYTITNKKNKSWCQIGILKSTISKGNIDADFDSEWQELVAKPYSITEPPQINEVQEKDDWKIKAGSGKFLFNNSNASAILTTASGYNRCVSIVAITNSQDYIKDIEAVLTSVDLTKPEVVIPDQTNTATDNTNDNTSIIGVWIATASDQSSFRVKNGVMNYIVRQYNFTPDGNYTFTSKAFDPLLNKILLGKEHGTYQISGTSITITPKKSVLEAWSKKDGADKWGKLLSSQNIPLEIVSYQFSKHFFSGIKETSLILQSDTPTKRDGVYSGNVTIKNSWIYSPVSTSHPIIKLPGE